MNDLEDLQRGRIVGIFSYCLFPIALIMHYTIRRTGFGAFHLRQALGIILGFMIIYILQNFLLVIALNFPGLTYPILGSWFVLKLIFEICLLILWLIGLNFAIKNKIKPTLYMGRYFNKWFSYIT